MIWHPKPNQVVRIHYRKSAAPFMPLHGCYGIIKAVSRGPGPINALVEVNVIDQMMVDHIIPRGNLVATE